MEQLINSGLSIKDALEICATINNKNDNIATLLYEQIQKGVSFADAVNNLNNIFPVLYRGIISVGDKVGSIENIFPPLRLYLEVQKKLKDKIVGAMLYPLIVLITALFVLIGMVFFVFPKLKEMFMEFGGEAAVLLGNNINRMERSFLIIFGIFIFLFISILILKLLSARNTNLKQKLDIFILKIPLIGKFFTYLETLKFSFAMETLISGGITIEDSIHESESVLTNYAYRLSLDDIRNRITKGESLSYAFSIHKNIFPDYLIKWMLVGEKSGKPEKVFSQLRNYFQNEIDLYTTKFMTLIEPALIILIGIFIIALVFNIIVPVFSLYGSIL